MKLFDWLKNLFSKDSSLSEEAKLLKKSIEIISMYGEVLEKTSNSRMTKYPLGLLKFTKEEIVVAAKTLKQAKSNAASRANYLKFLTTEQTNHIMSDYFIEQIDAGLIFLDCFVDDQEAKKANDEWNKALKMGRDIQGKNY